MTSTGVPPSPRDTAAVIVNYRTKELTRGAIASVLAQSEVRAVVVVDNASDDGSAGFLRDAFATDPRVRVVESGHNGGFGRGVNLGVSRCDSSLVLILNSDATVAPGALGLLADTLLADGDLGVVAPSVFGPDGQTLDPRAFGDLPDRRHIVLARGRSRAGSPDEPGWVSGVAMLLRRADFIGAGGFDEGFRMYFEDVDLCRRLREGGKGVRRVPAAAVLHAGGGSWRSGCEKRRLFQESKAHYFEKIGATPFELGCIRILGGLRTTLARIEEWARR